jgi:uridylate kinase
MALHVISLGGSLIVPEEIDVDFLKKFKEFILKRIKKKDRFILIAGGGKICRKYQQAASEISEIDNLERDWIGIHTTRLNAHLIKTIFKDIANPIVIKNPRDDKVDFKESVLVGAGWKPGCSTDFDAVLIAKRFNAKSIINLSNVDYVYTADPKKDPNAKKIEKISWKDFKKIVGDKWDPGLNAPFDPVASKEAEASNMSVAILNGRDLDNLNNFLDNKDFKGTLIS